LIRQKFSNDVVLLFYISLFMLISTVLVNSNTMIGLLYCIIVILKTTKVYWKLLLQQT